VIEMYNLRMVGPSARVTRFGEDGWQVGATVVWNNDAESAFAEVLAEALDVPLDEAVKVAKESLLEWGRRTDPDESQQIRPSMIAALFGTFGLAVVGTVAVLALVVWALVSLL
jgi:hypothetical protein